MHRLPLIESLESRQLLSGHPLVAHGVRSSPVEGQAFSNVVVATFKDKDATPDPLSNYSATIVWGDGSTSSAGAVVVDPAGGFDVTGSHTYVAKGPYRAVVQISDSDGHSAKATAMEKVLDAPITITGQAIAATASVLFQGVVATYTDADPRSATGPVKGQTAVIHWGDGKTSAGTIALNPTTNMLEVSGKHTYAAVKTFTIQTAIREAGVPPTTATSPATVAAPAPTLTPSLIGDFVGTAKAKSSGGLFGKIVSDFSGTQSFEFVVTDQTLDTITGTFSIAGNSASGTLTGVELNNRHFHFALPSGDGMVSGAFQALISTDGKVIAGNIQATFVGSKTLTFNGSFTAMRQSGMPL